MFGRVLAAVAVLAAALSQPSQAAAAGVTPCQVIGFSPDFSTDRTALCAHQDSSDPVVGLLGSLQSHNGPVTTYLTTDAGRSWRKTVGSGLPGSNDDHFSPTLTQVIFSPQFALDHAIYLWAASDGLFQSTDLGANWTKLPGLPLSGEPGTGIMTPLSVTTTEDTEKHTRTSVGGFAYAFENTVCVGGEHAPTDALIVWPDVTPATGSHCRADQQYLVPRAWPSSPALLLNVHHFTGPTGREPQSAVSECAAALDCRKDLLVLPGQRIVQGWADPLSDATFSLWTLTGRDTARVFRTTDGGAHWASWASVQALLSGRSIKSVSLAGDVRHRTLLVTGSLTAAESGAAGGSFGMRLYDSVDRGATWTLRAVQPLSGNPGRGGLPFDAAYGYRLDRGAVQRAGGRLFILAAKGQAGGVWCSLDDGESWTPRCRD